MDGKRIVCCTECGSEVVWRHEGIVLNADIIVRESGGYGYGEDEIDFDASENTAAHSI